MYTSYEMIHFAAHFDELKKYMIIEFFKKIYGLRNIFNCVLLQRGHLTAWLPYNDFG